MDSVWLDVWDEDDTSLHGLVTQRGFQVLQHDDAELDAFLRQIIECTLTGTNLANAIRERALTNAPARGGPFGMPRL